MFEIAKEIRDNFENQHDTDDTDVKKMEREQIKALFREMLIFGLPLPPDEVYGDTINSSPISE